MDLVILFTYGIALLLIFFYSLMQLSLVINYRRGKRLQSKSTDGLSNHIDIDKLPFITIQLPIYNEKYVIERLLDSVALIRYPIEKMEIQVLDDSTDDSIRITAKKVIQLKQQGINISHIRRPQRTGFKAGALEYGLRIAKGEFITIFDADFIPHTDFLLHTIPHFSDKKVGVVQTRWGHINKDYSLLTRLQAFGLDAHFTVEQLGRNTGGYFINFNGTAGIWRKSCIEDAGGWQYDTLTEDLDLSYRAQLKGWKFKYLENEVTNAELPVVMSALKNQQFRWNKGGAENFVKMKSRIIRNKNIPLKTKIHGIFHLFNSAIFLCVFTTALLSVPIMFIKYTKPQYNLIFNISSIFLVCTALLMVFYWNSYQNLKPEPMRKTWQFIREFVLFLATSMGLSFHNSVAVIEGYLGKKSSFIRTPKFNIVNSNDSWKGNIYLAKNVNLITVIEGLLAAYFLFAIISAFVIREYGLLPFHLMLFWGFAFIFWLSIRQVNR